MADITEHQFPKASINNLTRSVLVTGGSGYVGSHCCKFLSKNGFIPVNIDRNLKNKPTAFGPSYDINLPHCLLYTSPSPRDGLLSRMPSSA